MVSARRRYALSLPHVRRPYLQDAPAAVENTEVAPESRAGGGRMRMVLHRSQDEDSTGDTIMEWVVATRVAGPHEGARYFVWT